MRYNVEHILMLLRQLILFWFFFWKYLLQLLTIVIRVKVLTWIYFHQGIDVIPLVEAEWKLCTHSESHCVTSGCINDGKECFVSCLPFANANLRCFWKTYSCYLGLDLKTNKQTTKLSHQLISNFCNNVTSFY